MKVQRAATGAERSLVYPQAVVYGQVPTTPQQQFGIYSNVQASHINYGYQGSPYNGGSHIYPPAPKFVPNHGTPQYRPPTGRPGYY